MLEDKNKPIDPDAPIYYLVRWAPPTEATSEAVGLAKSTEGKSFLLMDQNGIIISVEGERISEAEFKSWAAMKLYPVFRPFKRGHVVLHRCRRLYGKKGRFGTQFEE